MGLLTFNYGSMKNHIATDYGFIHYYQPFTFDRTNPTFSFDWEIYGQVWVTVGGYSTVMPNIQPSKLIFKTYRVYQLGVL